MRKYNGKRRVIGTSDGLSSPFCLCSFYPQPPLYAPDLFNATPPQKAFLKASLYPSPLSRDSIYCKCHILKHLICL